MSNRRPDTPTKPSGLDAVLLLAVRDAPGGRYGSAMKPEVAQALLQSIEIQAGWIVFPIAALEKAGCPMSRWSKAAGLPMSGIRVQEINGQSCYVMARDTSPDTDAHEILLLKKWADPAWHARAVSRSTTP